MGASSLPQALQKRAPSGSAAPQYVQYIETAAYHTASSPTRSGRSRDYTRAMPTRHIVLVKVRSGIPDAQVAEAFDALAALKGVIPGLLTFSAGPNTSPEGRTLGFTHGFVMDFEDAAARDAYLPHPKHTEAAAHLRAIREPENGVLVFDYDM